MRRILLQILLLLAPLHVASAMEAASPLQRTQEAIGAYLSNLTENATLAERHQGYAVRVFNDTVYPIIDGDMMARRAMGLSYDRASERQKQAFTSAFRAYLSQMWVNLFYSVEAGEIRWQPVEYTDQNTRAVLTAKLGSLWFGTRIRFKLYWSESWRVYDVDIDRKSIVRGTRADFNESLEGHSLARALAAYIKDAPALPLVTLGATDWSPYVASNLPGNGLAASIVTQAFAAVGYRVDYRFQPLRKLNDLAIAGEVDGFVTAWEDQEDDSIILTDPYLANWLVFIKRKDDPFALDGNGKPQERVTPAHYRLGVYRDVNYGPSLDAYLKDFKQHERDYCSQLFRDVASKSLDLAIVDQWVADIELAGKDNVASYLTKVVPPVEMRTVHVSLQKTADNYAEHLAEAFNAGLNIIRKNGTYASTLAKHQYPDE